MKLNYGEKVTRKTELEEKLMDLHDVFSTVVKNSIAYKVQSPTESVNEAVKMLRWDVNGMIERGTSIKNSVFEMERNKEEKSPSWVWKA